jgi:hypothetical protein
MSSSYRENSKIPVDKICFFIACLYLGFVVAWLVNRQNQAPTQPAPSAQSESDRQFIAYLQSSLALLDRSPSPATPAPSPTVSLPPPPIAVTPPTTPRVIERVYVPVYPQTPTTGKPATPGEIATAPLPPPLVPSIATAPASTLPPSIPTSERVKNTLVGVMDLGDRSSALFDNQGVTTRISTGEFINGWTLVGVREQQVILSRGGITKVLEVGQSF